MTPFVVRPNNIAADAAWIDTALNLEVEPGNSRSVRGAIRFATIAAANDYLRSAAKIRS